MRSPPKDLTTERLKTELAAGWGMLGTSMDYLPEGGGSHHWLVLDQHGQRHFVTVDDLDDKDWLGDTRDVVFEGLVGALRTADSLRHEAGLDFVVAPVAAKNGEIVRRIDVRYTVSLFPFVLGRSHAFGPYSDAGLREAALDMVAALHQSTAAVRERATQHVLRYGGQHDLNAVLADSDRPWSGGPFSEPARFLIGCHLEEISELVEGFEHLAELTAPIRLDTVITHGEPHPGNLISTDEHVLLVDWDTVALAPPERDLALIATTPGESVERYEEATGRAIDFTVITLYRLRWYLDDLASAVRLYAIPTTRIRTPSVGGTALHPGSSSFRPG